MTLQELLNEVGVSREQVLHGFPSLSEETWSAPLVKLRPGFFRLDDEGMEVLYVTCEPDKQAGYAVSVRTEQELA